MLAVAWKGEGGGGGGGEIENVGTEARWVGTTTGEICLLRREILAAEREAKWEAKWGGSGSCRRCFLSTSVRIALFQPHRADAGADRTSPSSSQKRSPIRIITRNNMEN